MSSRAWTTFRAVRVVLFALATLLTIAWTIMYMVLLLREWSTYNTAQRAIVIMSLVINGVSAILLYLMIVVHFRVWLDAARVAFVLLFQLASTVTFALFSPNLPCNNLGSETDCRHVTSAVINGGWTLLGLLLFYAFYLAVMSYIPMPPPRPNPEAALSDTKSPRSTTPSRIWFLNAEKRLSKGSASSFIQPLSANPSLHRSPNPSVKSLSVSSRQYGIYRPNSPASFYSSASSSISSVRGHRGAPSSLYPPTSVQAPASQPFPNPLVDPVFRKPSPLSESITGANYNQDSSRPHIPIATPPAIALPYGSGQVFPPSPYTDKRFLIRSHAGPPGMPGSPFSPGHLMVPGTPVSLRPSVQSSSPPREYTASPAMQSVRSMAASLHTSSSFTGSPAMSPRSLGLPASPRVAVVPPLPHAASGGSSVGEIRRYASVPTSLNAMAAHQAFRGVTLTPDFATPSTDINSHGVPESVTYRSDGRADFGQWRKYVLEAAHSDRREA